MTYEQVAHFAQNWGLVYFVLAFIGVVLFALRPSSKKRYEDAARMPLRED